MIKGKREYRAKFEKKKRFNSFIFKCIFVEWKAQHLAMSKLEGESTSGNKESVDEENVADGQDVEATALLNLEKTTENVIYNPISSLKIGAVK